MRWLTVAPPGQPELNVLLERVGPAVRRRRDRRPARRDRRQGRRRHAVLRGRGRPRDVRPLVEKGVEIVQEPIERFYGIDAAFRDDSGNQLRINQPADTGIPWPEGSMTAAQAAADRWPRGRQLHPARRAARRRGAPRELRHPPLPAALPPDVDGRDRPARRGGVRPRRHAAAGGVRRAVRARARVGAHGRAGGAGRLGLPGALPRPGGDRRLGGGGRGAARRRAGSCSATSGCGGRWRPRTPRWRSSRRGWPWTRRCSRPSTRCGRTWRPGPARARGRGRSTPRCGGPGATSRSAGRSRCALAELAAVAGLSRFELARTFRAQVGLPPHAFQLDLRVARARALLAAGEPPRGGRGGVRVLRPGAPARACSGGRSACRRRRVRRKIVQDLGAGAVIVAAWRSRTSTPRSRWSCATTSRRGSGSTSARSS